MGLLARISKLAQLSKFSGNVILDKCECQSMDSEEESAVVEQDNEAEEQGLEEFQRVSETEINILKEKADMKVEGQEEKLDMLRNQADRLWTIKYGVLALILVAGIYNGVEGSNPTTIDIFSSIVWFLLIGIFTISGTIYFKNAKKIFEPFIFGEELGNSHESSQNKLIDELLEVAKSHSGESSADLERKAERIIKNRRDIKRLERDLRFSHLILALVFALVLILGLPSFTLLELLSPV